MEAPGVPNIKVESWGDDPKGAFERLLCHGGVLVMVDPAVAGLVLPPQLAERERVVLDYDIDPSLPVLIPDLEATDEGIRATLSFSREPHATFVPWAAVLVMMPKRQPVAPQNKHDGRKLKLV